MIEALLQICKARGLRCEDLDEAVHDAAEKTATLELNRLVESSQHEAILSDNASQASRINNSGLRAQVEFLVGILGADKARQILLQIESAPGEDNV